MTTNYTHLADLYAVAKAEAEAVQKRLADLRAAILATGRETLVGDVYTVTVTLSERETLDSKAVREILTAKQLEAVTKTTEVETIRVKASLAEAA